MPSVSFSRIKTWRRCHYQHHLKYHERLARKRRTIPLLRGTILGEMLDARAIPIMKKDPYKILRKYEKQYAQLFREEQEKWGNVPDEMRRLFEGYVRHYAHEDLKYLTHEEFIALDLVKDIRFIGYIDKRVEDGQGRQFLMDHKANKNIPTEEQRFSDLQKVFYIWAFNETHKSERVSGFIWDYIRTKAPTIPELLKDGKSLSQRKDMDTDYYTYSAELKKHRIDPKPYMDFLAMLRKKTSTRYIRVTNVAPSKKTIENLVKDLKDTAIELHSSKARDRNMTRMCPHDCDFFDLCRAEITGMDSDFVRKTEYEEREPDEREEAEEE